MEKDEQEWKIFNKECPRDEQKIEVKLLGNVLKGYYSGLVGNFFVSEKDGEHILLFCTHNLKWRPVLQRTDSGISISEIVKCGQWKKLNIANNLEPNRHEYMFTDENGECYRAWFYLPEKKVNLHRPGKINTEEKLNDYLKKCKIEELIEIAKNFKI